MGRRKVIILNRTYHTFFVSLSAGSGVAQMARDTLYGRLPKLQQPIPCQAIYVCESIAAIKS